MGQPFAWQGYSSILRVMYAVELNMSVFCLATNPIELLLRLSLGTHRCACPDLGGMYTWTRVTDTPGFESCILRRRCVLFLAFFLIPKAGRAMRYSFILGQRLLLGLTLLKLPAVYELRFYAFDNNPCPLIGFFESPLLHRFSFFSFFSVRFFFHVCACV